MICERCNSEMILDDVDTHSKWSRDKYWVCEKCDRVCVEEIKNNETVNITWQEY